MVPKLESKQEINDSQVACKFDLIQDFNLGQSNFSRQTTNGA